MSGSLTFSPIGPIGINTAVNVSGSYAFAPSFVCAADGGTASMLPSGATLPLTMAGALYFNYPGFAVSGTHQLAVTDKLTGVSGVVTVIVSGGLVIVPTVLWNRKDIGGPTYLSSDMLTAIASGNATAYAQPQGVRALTAIPTTEPIAFEIGIGKPTQNWACGIADKTFDLVNGGGLGVDVHSLGFYVSTGPNSQPPQSIWFDSKQTIGGTISSPDGDVVSVIANNQKVWFSTGVMRAGGNMWNDNPTADPAKSIGGVSFVGMGVPHYPTWTTGEGGGSTALLNGGKASGGFSQFLQTYMQANPSVKALDS